MSKLQTSAHKKTRSFLRVAGVLIVMVGLVFTLVGFASFFMSFGKFEFPRFFWCGFIGLPLLFVGGAMCLFGFLGAVARYTAAEQVPVAKDAITDLADGTQDAVKTVARSVAEGVQEALQDKPKI